MIQSTQKIIKVGSSGGVTIPAKELKHNNLTYGDTVKDTIEPIKDGDKQSKLIEEYKEFVAEYGDTLKNLSDR